MSEVTASTPSRPRHHRDRGDAATPLKGTVVSKPTVPAPTVPELQAEVAAAREEFGTALATLKGEVQPAALVDRTGRTVKGWFTDEHGSIRPDRVAIAAGVVVGFIGLRLLGRRR